MPLCGLRLLFAFNKRNDDTLAEIPDMKAAHFWVKRLAADKSTRHARVPLAHDLTTTVDEGEFYVSMLQAFFVRR